MSKRSSPHRRRRQRDEALVDLMHTLGCTCQPDVTWAERGHVHILHDPTCPRTRPELGLTMVIVPERCPR